MKKYAYLGSGTGEKFCIKGIDVYKYRWLMEGDCVIVTDPKTKKPRSFSVYKIRAVSYTHLTLPTTERV